MVSFSNCKIYRQLIQLYVFTNNLAKPTIKTIMIIQHILHLQMLSITAKTEIMQVEST